VADQITHQSKAVHEHKSPITDDKFLAQAIEFLRQADAKKVQGGFWGPVTLKINYEDGVAVSVDLNDGFTLRKKKK